ncbi:MAG: sigma-54 dependent transcriptional regulator [Isosphaeraceae bacterium]
MSKSTAPLIVIADDDEDFLRITSHHLRSWSYNVACAASKSQLLAALAERRPDLLLLDVRFGDHDGVEILRQLRADRPDLPIAILTAYGGIDNAVAAIRLGAMDYLTKPLDLDRLRATVNHALEDRAAAGPGATAPRPPGQPGGLTRPIIGKSEAIRQLLGLIQRVAASDAGVLILGESGTGKELVASAIHELSPRAAAPFVPLNMAALPRELTESVLFGHGKGAFTGAEQLQRGCCEAADRGTLFLDEIGEMEIGLQAKLLRFLQERSFLRVGQVTPVQVDVRIIAATNRNPLDQIRRGSLREDLYYRLSVVPIVLPSLRDRREDVPVLVEHFLGRLAARSARPVPRFDDSALAELRGHDWPGNVRELENLIERLAILHPGPVLDAAAVKQALAAVEIPRLEPRVGRTDAGRAGDTAPPSDPDLTAIERIEREAIVQALAKASGSVREAAHDLGLSQATIYRKIKRYGISN